MGNYGKLFKKLRMEQAYLHHCKMQENVSIEIFQKYSSINFTWKTIKRNYYIWVRLGNGPVEKHFTFGKYLHTSDLIKQFLQNQGTKLTTTPNPNLTPFILKIYPVLENPVHSVWFLCSGLPENQKLFRNYSAYVKSYHKNLKNKRKTQLNGKKT